MSEVAVGGLESAAPPSGAERRHFPTFDGYRAVAAGAVLLTHVSFITHANVLWGGSFLARADVGVTVFFLVSGFLLYRPFAVRLLANDPLPSVAAYLWRRALRIFPAYWFAAGVIAYGFGINRPDSLGEFVLHFGLLHIYVEDQLLAGPIFQAWTLAVEIAFYLYLPVFAAALAAVGRRLHVRQRLRLQLAVLALMAVVATVWRVAVLDSTSGETAGMLLTWPVNYLDQFALGMGLAVLSAWWSRPGASEPALVGRPWFAAAAWVLAAAAFVAVSIGIGLPTSSIAYSDGEQLARHLLYTATAFFFLLPGVFGDQDRGWIRKFLRHRAVQAAGLISYGLYLWHEAFIDRVLEWTDRVPFSGDFWTMLGAVVVLSTVAATVSYVVVEKPALALKQRLPRSRA